MTHVSPEPDVSRPLVYPPQRDGVEPETSPYDAMTPEQRRHAMFRFDRQRILDCHIFVIVLDGRIPDEGACVELGIAHGQKYLQVRVALDSIVDDEEALLRVLSGNGPQLQPVEERSDEPT